MPWIALIVGICSLCTIPIREAGEPTIRVVCKLRRLTWTLRAMSRIGCDLDLPPCRGKIFVPYRTDSVCEVSRVRSVAHGPATDAARILATRYSTRSAVITEGDIACAGAINDCGYDKRPSHVLICLLPGTAVCVRNARESAGAIIAVGRCAARGIHQCRYATICVVRERDLPPEPIRDCLQASRCIVSKCVARRGTTQQRDACQSTERVILLRIAIRQREC